MYKFWCSLSALILGVITIVAYDFMFSSQWYSKVSTQTISLAIDGFSVFFQREFEVPSWALTLIQATILSLIFALVFSMVLDVFISVVKVVHYAILGAFAGVLYIVLPTFLLFVDEHYFNRQLYASPSSHVDLMLVLVGYLPLLIGVFYISVSRRMKLRW